MSGPREAAELLATKARVIDSVTRRDKSPGEPHCPEHLLVNSWALLFVTVISGGCSDANSFNWVRSIDRI
jgi:hypothetical protein